MPDYPVFDVNVLLETLAKEAGVPKLDKGGLDILSRQLRAKGNPYDVKISARYLKERLCDRLQQAVDDDQPLIDLSQAYIDSISHFLGFNSFTAFQKAQNSLQQWLPGVQSPKPEDRKILVIHGGKDRNQPEEIKRLTEQIEVPVIWISMEGKEEIRQQISDASLVLCALGDLKDLDRIESFLPGETQTNPPPVFLYSLGGNASLEKSLPVRWQEKPLLNRPRLNMVLTLFEVGLEDKKDRESEPTIGPTGPHLKNSGAIVGGKHKFKGKYQNVGTMNITINKNKPKP
ncbi:MAG: hypothetical protein RLP14_06815 [Owenweeksia sp.]